MKKRKFNLGEIIKKINEEKSPYDEVENSGDDVAKPGNEETTEPEEATSTIPTESTEQIPSIPLSQNSGQTQNRDDCTNSKIYPEKNEVNSQKSSSTFAINKDDEEEEEFEIGKYISIILRRKCFIALIMLFAVIYSGYSYLTSGSHYYAYANMLFHPEGRDIFGAEHTWNYLRDREKALNTHLELFKSNTVASMVSANLNNRIKPQSIIENLTVGIRDNNGEKTNIIELKFRHHDPEMAKDVLNELCRTYNDYRRHVNAQELTNLIIRLEKQIAKLDDELKVRENRLREFKEQNRMAQLSNETNLLISKMSEMELALQQTNLDLIESRERLTGLQNQISQQEINTIQSITYQDPFQDKLAELELELSTLLAERSSEHFRVRTLKQKIENLKTVTMDSISRKASRKTFVNNPIRQNLLQKYTNETIEKSALKTKQAAQKRIIETLNLELLALPQIQQTHAHLEREAKNTLATLELLKNRYEEAKIKKDSQESDLKILEYAETPGKAISDYQKSMILITIFLGLVLGIGVAFVIEYLDQSVKDPSEMERTLETPLLGVVPLIEAEASLIKDTDKIPKSILEPFRALRANIKHLLHENKLKTFMVCSAVKGEGKTTMAANLAISFAMDGKKVILIDADLRRSHLHHLFNVPADTGLSEYLFAQKDCDEIIKGTEYENLFIITSGSRPDNPSELLGTYRFDKFISELRTKADIVIFDSPALLPVSDTLIMAPKMDACLMVVRILWTPVKAAKQAKYQLSRIGCKIFGGILNGVSYSNGYYPYYGYYGYYSYKYNYEDDSTKKLSLRKLGVNLEEKGKRGIKNFTYRIPAHISSAASFSRSLIKKKTFLLLLLTFMALLIANVWLKIEKPANEGSINYVGYSSDEKIKSEKTSEYNDIAFFGSKTSKRDQLNDTLHKKGDSVIFRDELEYFHEESLE
ncbi:polysaccharide biosynthesis tyrosine autokinase [Chitinispirillales bacterium ANBcel5]|uniref:GumC family protein n=1 Tax=Cellulosispirillum alkaliphilum TaxID=3039283 RepID=UPI002A50E78D|nr:polysaccharide biosynthesis tyrosine autokinase [Chitinispirillales bacterium ANBcel5]